MWLSRSRYRRALSLVKDQTSGVRKVSFRTTEKVFMIRDYRDQSANERTFLAWVRTGIAVIAFGFVIEKFNLFVLTMAATNSLDAARRLQLERLSGPLGRYDGVALIQIGRASC